MVNSYCYEDSQFLFSKYQLQWLVVWSCALLLKFALSWRFILNQEHQQGLVPLSCHLMSSLHCLSVLLRHCLVILPFCSAVKTLNLSKSFLNYSWISLLFHFDFDVWKHSCVLFHCCWHLKIWFCQCALESDWTVMKHLVPIRWALNCYQVLSLRMH